MKVERATLDDFDELIALMDRSFGYRNPREIPFRKLLPDLYRPTEEAAACHRVIRRGGHLVASLGIYPVDLQMGRVRLRVGGIGAVSTDPKHRGQGYMSLLLEEAKREMAREGYALSWLSGDRARYARFGWEKAGSPPHVALTARGFAPADIKSWRIARFMPGRSDPADIVAARRRLAWKGLCDDATLPLKFGRLNVEVGEARRGRKHAYVAFQTWDKRVVEWGGDPAGVQALVGRRIAEGGTWWAALPPARDEYTDLFLSRAEDAAFRLDNLAIVDLRNLLTAYGEILARRWPAGRTLRLVMRTKRGVSDVAIEDRAVRSAGGRADVRLELDELKMVRLLFGPVRPTHLLRLPPRAAWLDQVFPLPFYMPYLWRV